MAKPSIFSKDYAKKMKQIRRRRVFICFIGILALIFSFTYVIRDKSFHLHHFNSIVKGKEKKQDKSKEKHSRIAKDDNSKNEETYYDVKLSDGSNLRLIYEVVNGEKKFKYIDNGDNKLNCSYNINPDLSGVIICDNSSQNIIYVNINGEISDITKKQYVSSSGDVFLKDNVIKNNANYIWARNPVFIDNENVAYVSELPWINQEGTKFLWIINVHNPENNNVFYNIYGNNIELGKIDAKGLAINIDGKSGFVDINGNFTE